MLADNPSLMLRKSDKNEIELSFKNDQLTKLKFNSHCFFPNSAQANYKQGKPFRLYHLGYGKYLSYSKKNKAIELSDDCPVLKGVFCL